MQPTPDEIRGQLDRILASESFVSSGRLSRFLRYVVDRTLAGDGDRLMEYTSAVQFTGVRRPLREIARALNANVVMEASLVNDGDDVGVEARLVDGRSDRKFWVQRFDGTVSRLPDLHREIAAAVSAAATRSPR